MDVVNIGRVAFKRRGLMLPIAIVLFLLPSPSLADSPASVGILGLLVALAGQAVRAGTIGLAYIIRGGKDHQVYAEELVTDGIYAHTRNPMYFGNAFLLAGLALASNSWLVATLGVTIALAWHAAIIAAEEDFLRAKFGAQFEEYCARVPRVLPKVRGLAATFRGMRFHWRRVLLQEYAKPFDWVAAIAMVVLANLWRAEQMEVHRVLVVVLVVIITARLALWVVARQLRPGLPSAAESRR